MGGRRGRLISRTDKNTAITLIYEAHASGARLHKACAVLGMSVRTLQRWRKYGRTDKRKRAEKNVRNKLSNEEKLEILRVANSSEYASLPPSQIVPLLADKSKYIASESTFYRVLREHKQSAHRGLSKAKKNKKPRSLVAIKPNQVWSWDISYLPSKIKGFYYYLYFVIDVYSRKVVGWNIHSEESSAHASNLFKQICLNEAINPNQLALHSDNGAPMRGASLQSMLESLGVAASFSRPSVSNDNPYSESLFKTLKYRPDYPKKSKFSSLADARRWVLKFVDWYNVKHLHSAIKFVTPNDRHNGDDLKILKKREAVYKQAKTKKPERWAGSTRDWVAPTAVFLNPTKDEKMLQDQPKKNHKKSKINLRKKTIRQAS